MCEFTKERLWRAGSQAQPHRQLQQDACPVRILASNSRAHDQLSKLASKHPSQESHQTHPPHPTRPALSTEAKRASGGGGRGERGNRPGPVGDLWGKVAGGVCFRVTGRVTEMPAGRACRAVGCWLLAAGCCCPMGHERQARGFATAHTKNSLKKQRKHRFKNQNTRQSAYRGKHSKITVFIMKNTVLKIE